MTAIKSKSCFNQVLVKGHDAATNPHLFLWVSLKYCICLLLEFCWFKYYNKGGKISNHDVFFLMNRHTIDIP